MTDAAELKADRDRGLSEMDLVGAQKVIESLQVQRNVYLTVLDAINLDLLPSGLELGEVYALLALTEAPNNRLGMTEVADRLHLPKSTATYMAKAMELRGLITRVQPDEDRRTIELVLTARGQRVLSTALPLFNLASTRRLFSFTTHDEWFGFTDSAAKIIESLEPPVGVFASDIR